MARVTQAPVEVAIEREFVSDVRVTQAPVEVAVQREFTFKARLTQLCVEVAVAVYVPPTVAEEGILFATFI